MERMKKNGSILAAVCIGVIGCVCIGLALKYGSDTQEATPDAPKEQHENDTLEKAKSSGLDPNSTQDDCATVANVENDQNPGRDTENEVANGQNGHDPARKANDTGLRSDFTQDSINAGFKVPIPQMDNTEMNSKVGTSDLANANTSSDDVVRKQQANPNESNLSNDASQGQSSDIKFRQSLKRDGVKNNSLKPVSKRTKNKRTIGASMNTYHKFDFQGLSNTCFMIIFLRLAILYPTESIEPFIDDATLKYLKIVSDFKKRVENDKSGTVIAGDVYKKALSARYDDIQNAMNNQNDPKEFSEYFFGEYACALSHTECVDVLPYVKIIYQDYYTLQYIPFLIYNFTSEIRNFDDLVKTGMRNYLELTSPNYYNEPEKRIFLQSGQLMTIQLNRSGQVIDDYIKIPDLCQYKLANEDEDKTLTRNDRITDFLVKEMPIVTNSVDASTNPDSSVKAKKNTNFTVDSGRLSSCLLDEFNKKEFNYDRYTFKLKAAVVYYPSSDVRFGVNHYEIYIVRDGVIYREDATCCTKMDDEARTLRLIGENGTFYTYEITERTD